MNSVKEMLVQEIYDLVEHGKMAQAVAKLDMVESSGRLNGLDTACKFVLAAAKAWRGRHMNTNDSCGDILALLKGEMLKTPTPPVIEPGVEMLREANAQLVASEQSIRNEANRLRGELQRLRSHNQLRDDAAYNKDGL